jgi:hypothetical protein
MAILAVSGRFRNLNISFWFAPMCGDLTGSAC